MWHRMGSYTPATAKWMHEGRHLVFSAGDNVKSTVPVLVAGIMPVAAAETTSPKVLLRATHREKPQGPRLAPGLVQWLCSLRWCPFLLNY